MADQAKTSTLKHWPRVAKSNGKKVCSIEGCKRPYRAKSYCFFHYKSWRQGALPHPRYRTCSKEECKVKVLKAGLCEKHFNEKYKKDAAAAA